jgi:predicted nucleotidyltransferase
LNQDSFAKLLDEARGDGLSFLLIGGHAVFAHGHARTTLDVDLIVPDTSLLVWKSWAKNQGYQPAHETDAFLQFARVTPGSVPLDLMKADVATFTKLQANAREFSFSGVSLPVVGLFHLLALKLHALKTPTRKSFHAQDWADLVTLIRKNRVDLRSPEFQNLMKSHATPQLEAQLLAELQPS